MSKDDPNIELRSEAVQEIIGRAPNWIIRWGSLTIGLVIVLIFIGSIVFKYPDKLISQVQFTSEQPPVEIVARKAGFLTTIFVQDSQAVRTNQKLGLIESSVDTAFINLLDSYLDSLSVWSAASDTGKLLSFLDTDWPRSGLLSEPFSELTETIATLTTAIILSKHQVKIAALNSEIATTRMHYDRLWNQKVIKSKELALAQAQWDRQTVLHNKKAISDLAFEKANQEFLSINYLFETSRSALTDYQMKLDGLIATRVETKIAQQEEGMRLLSNIDEAIIGLKGAVADWEHNYLFRSPVDGIVVFTDVWAKNQRISSDQNVFTIVQEDPTEIVGKIKLPIKGAGKVRVGQQVLIQLDKYSYMEYGMLKGTVQAISLVSSKDYYTLALSLDNGLISTYGKELELSEGMVGQAEVITENRSLLVRIVDPLKAVLNRNLRIE